MKETAICGPVTYYTMADFFKCIRTEKEAYNFTLPNWINDEVYSQSMELLDIYEDYIYGGGNTTLKTRKIVNFSENFGMMQDHELTRLLVGLLLKTMIEDMDNSINEVSNTEKFYVYGAV